MTALSPLAEHYLQLAKNPINDGDFAGADMRYSGEFETLEDELEKAASLHQTEAIDWQKIRDLSEALLRHHSKDLRAACWMTWATALPWMPQGALSPTAPIKSCCSPIFRGRTLSRKP